MVLNVIAVTCIVIFAVGPCWGRERIVSWETGTVLDVERNQELVGTAEHVSTFGYSSYSATTTIYNRHQDYAIESDRLIYLAREHLRSHRSQPALLTVGGTVKFHADQAKLILLDNAGKEHEARVVKLVAKSQNAVRRAASHSDLITTNPATLMTNGDVINLKNSGIGEDLIILKIRSTKGAYTLDPASIITLHQAAISDVVIAAMIGAATR